MQSVNSVIANPSISHFPGLSPLVYALGMFFAYLFLPSALAAAGFVVESK